MGHENPQAVFEVKRAVAFIGVNAVLCKHDINVVVIETDYTSGYVLKTIPPASILTDGSCRPFSVHRINTTVCAESFFGLRVESIIYHWSEN